MTATNNLARIYATAVLVFAGSTAALASDADVIREAKDRAEIEKLMWDYARALDTGNAEAYAALYTEDGAFGAVKGREALKKMITEGRKTLAERQAKGAAAPGRILHMTADHYVEFIDKDHVRVHIYWLTAFVPPPAAPGAAGPEPRVPVAGRGVDELERVKGKWLIKSRDVAPKD